MLDKIQRAQREFSNLSDEKFTQCHRIMADNKSGLTFKEELDRAIEEITGKCGGMSRKGYETAR